jgi:hypothetical protein
LLRLEGIETREYTDDIFYCWQNWGGTHRDIEMVKKWLEENRIKINI